MCSSRRFKHADAAVHGAFPRVLPLLLAFCLSFGALAAHAAAKPAAKPARPLLAVPWQVSVLTPPVIFQSNGRRHLAYEIQITNFSGEVWSLQHIDVHGDDGAQLLAVKAEELPGILQHAGQKAEATGASAKGAGAKGAAAAHAPANDLAPGESMIAYMWIDLDEKTAVPAHLHHRLTARRNADAKLMDLDAPATAVSNELREISSPLRGSGWLAVNGPSNTSHHRRATLVLDGSAHTSQRYAIDWVQVGEDLKSYRGDPKLNSSYLCYGAQVLAVADGVVVEIKDGIVQNVPNQPPAVPITLDSVAGNHIDLDLGGGVYAMYAHLQPGSLRVKLGDRVKRGQVLALLGNTGNSTEPHLHFQLMDRNSPLLSEGLPYTLGEYTIAKRLSGDFDAQPTATALAKPEVHRGEMPMEMQLVNFK